MKVQKFCAESGTPCLVTMAIGMIASLVSFRPEPLAKPQWK
jgi:hypothetical protein